MQDKFSLDLLLRDVRLVVHQGEADALEDPLRGDSFSERLLRTRLVRLARILTPEDIELSFGDLFGRLYVFLRFDSFRIGSTQRA